MAAQLTPLQQRIIDWLLSLPPDRNDAVCFCGADLPPGVGTTPAAVWRAMRQLERQGDITNVSYSPHMFDRRREMARFGYTVAARHRQKEA